MRDQTAFPVVSADGYARVRLLQELSLWDPGSHLVTDGHLTAFMCRLLDLIHHGNGIVVKGDAAVTVCVGDQLGGA